MLERFGRADDNAWYHLSPSEHPRKRVGVDLWKNDHELSDAMQAPELKLLLDYHRVRSTVTMVRNVEPGLHQITSHVSWKVRRGGFVRSEEVSYTRFIVEEQTL